MSKTRREVFHFSEAEMIAMAKEYLIRRNESLDFMNYKQTDEFIVLPTSENQDFRFHLGVVMEVITAYENPTNEDMQKIVDANEKLVKEWKDNERIKPV